MIRFATPGEENGCESSVDHANCEDIGAVLTAVEGTRDDGVVDDRNENARADGRIATILNRESTVDALFDERVALLDEPVDSPLLESYLGSAVAAHWGRYGCWPIDERDAAVLNALISAHRLRRWKAIRGWVGGLALLVVGSVSTAIYMGWEALPGQTELFWKVVGWQQWLANQISLDL